MLGTDPLVADTDGDGLKDKADPKPLEMANPIAQGGKPGGIAIKSGIVENNVTPGTSKGTGSAVLLAQLEFSKRFGLDEDIGTFNINAVRIWIVFQLTDIVEFAAPRAYDHEISGARAFADGTATQLREQRNLSGDCSAARLSHTSISEHQTPRPLLTPGEVLQLPMDDALVLVSAVAPFRAKKPRYFEDSNFHARRLSAPTLAEGRFADTLPIRADCWTGCTHHRPAP